MKILMYSFAYGDKAIKQSKITNPLKESYCRLHGYDYYYAESQKMPVRHPYWLKIEKALELLGRCDILAYLDADAAPVEFGLKIEDFVPNGIDFAVCKDAVSWNGESWYMNAGVFLMRSANWTRDFLEEWNKEDPVSKRHAFHDQDRLNRLYKADWNGMRSHVKIWDTGTLQSTNSGGYRDGCFVKHCAGCGLGDGFEKEFWKNIPSGKREKLALYE